MTDEEWLSSRALLCPNWPTCASEYSLEKKVSIVTGGKQGIGLEIAMALTEAGSTVYSIDLEDSKTLSPSGEFMKVKNYLEKLRNSEVGEGVGRLEYVKGDVRKQDEMWKLVEEIGNKEGRVDIVVANAGILSFLDLGS